MERQLLCHTLGVNLSKEGIKKAHVIARALTINLPIVLGSLKGNETFKLTPKLLERWCRTKLVFRKTDRTEKLQVDDDVSEKGAFAEFLWIVDRIGLWECQNPPWTVLPGRRLPYLVLDKKPKQKPATVLRPLAIVGGDVKVEEDYDDNSF